MSTAAPAPVKFNTEVRDSPPDVDAYDGPLRHRCVDLIARLGRGELDVDDYQREVAAVLRAPGLLDELGPQIDRALAERKDQVFYRRQHDGRRDTLQLLYLEAFEVHPPHCHHNLISNQMNVSGRCHVREYDRVARLDDSTLLLRLARDDWFGVGDVMQTTEVVRNAHWFAADANPCVVLNFYLLGYQDWTFDPPAPRRRAGRQMVDPTLSAQRDGLIVAKEIDYATSYAKFGNRPLAEFPVPRP